MNVNNYLKLVVRAPQNTEQARNGKLGDMLTHELFTFGPGDRGVVAVLESLAAQVEQERAEGNTATLSAHNPAPLMRYGFDVDRIGRLDFCRSKMNLSLSQLGDRHRSQNRKGH